jgi:putative tryptophan/tyrosine transport system substrate-binding protein
MNRKIAVLTVCAVLFALCFSASAQHPNKVFRIGYLTTLPTTLDSNRRQEIRRALQELGYVEGQNISTLYRSAEGDTARLPGLAAELVKLNVDVLVVAGGFGPIRAAADATKTIPIIMTGGGLDPVEAGLIESLARPGGNITGFTNVAGHLGGKRLELLKEAVPKVVRVAVLFQAKNPRNTFEFKEVLPASARALGLTLLRTEVRDVADFERAFAAITKDRPDGLSVLGGPLMQRSHEPTTTFAIKKRLPSVYDERAPVELGGLLFYGADVMESYHRVAVFVDKILKGRKPADLPVEQPTKFEFVINLKTAKQIGLTISPDLVARATRIIR